MSDTAPEPRGLPIANPRVIFKQLSDGAVLFSPSDEVYYGLNEVGAKVWTLLPPASATLEEITAAIAASYPGVDPAVIRTDVAELITELLAHGLLIPDANANSSGDDAGQTTQARGPRPARVD